MSISEFEAVKNFLRERDISFNFHLLSQAPKRGGRGVQKKGDLREIVLFLIRSLLDYHLVESLSTVCTYSMARPTMTGIRDSSQFST
jgi:hypothetical protein